MSGTECNVEIQGWSVQRALKDLDITEVPFDPELLETTEHGYIQNREIAVNHSESRRGSKRSLGYGARSLLHVYLHEIAHVVLGHTTGESAEDYTPSLVAEHEVEAESTVLAFADLLGLDDDDLVNRNSCRSTVFLQANLWKFAVQDETGCEQTPDVSDIGVQARQPKVDKAAATIVKAGASK